MLENNERLRAIALLNMFLSDEKPSMNLANELESILASAAAEDGPFEDLLHSLALYSPSTKSIYLTGADSLQALCTEAIRFLENDVRR
jgi:hypothetical protein